jgi:hypothetical protein
MLLDTTIIHNFSLMDCAKVLLDLCGGRITLVHGVVGLDDDDDQEVERLRASFMRRAMESVGGSLEQSRYVAAATNIDSLLANRGDKLHVHVLTQGETRDAVRLQTPDRNRKLQLNLKALQLGAGESACIAAAIHLRLPLATDDDDARKTYLGEGGIGHFWTRDLVKIAVGRGLLNEHEAKREYEALTSRYRFFGVPWD